MKAAQFIANRPGPWSFIRFEHSLGNWHWRLFTDDSQAVWKTGQDVIFVDDYADLPHEALPVIHEGLALYVAMLESPRPTN